MAELLDDHTIEERLGPLDGWRREGDEIVTDRKLPDFAAAMAFVNAVADAAEAANHHPDILVHDYNQVRLSVTNHSAGGLTQADIDLAATIDALPGG
ncbi:MAG: 4a-hydroxytetrahydrobiopterin dehydratase [Conexibacter sp.]|jgi:4a-hydroxytetrahydrobiopterin dehydratase|nr:4a-hydroxytetrahydrobiopterin dehydratase [Conexibacter sp.]MCZ4495075.1 4a-hydroxytetrahydrobiopterin dehydratase [Conexibacter sp.]MDX6714452.1 4a-hydroxytetrahydrobiopterin dehydratase [Baekduia sp.]MDX6732482.1 4a-hydroxytetrahydrobiopterin dehydratase [Baekduia sp.]MEA2286201.1 4a-hydroxytetrahydrobiopterin dehydratase [Solirubrobacteraceae bacterium]